MAKLTNALRSGTPPKSRVDAGSRVLGEEEIARVRSEFARTGKAVVTDRSGNRFLISRRGK
ncbi:hypothetical protein [Terriglobus aquaticus]|uniref:Uncharacterized protein n=1 Tax=Terriglobus aquaticus TaxID=940139 RepID=A0ABW9KF61_9BACT